MASPLPARLMRNTAGAMSPGLQALVLYTLIVGNQWITDRIWEWVSINLNQSLAIDLARVITFPNWRLLPDERWESPWGLWIAVNLSTLAFLVTTALLLRWIGARHPSARRSRSFLSGLIATLLAALLSQVLFNVTMGLLVTEIFVGWSDNLGDAVRAGLFFGVIVGLFNRRRGSGGPRVARTSGGASSIGFAMNNAADNNNATRYLCVAAFTDETFADRVVNELFENNLRAVACSPGVDLSSVVKYCLAARRRRQRRDIALFLVTVATVILTFVSVWFLALGLLVLYGLIVAGFLAADRFVAEHLTAKNWNPSAVERQEPEASQTQRLWDIEEAQQGNVVVYSGFSPFIGLGSDVTGWSFTVPIVSANNHNGNGRAKPIVPFTAVDLAAAIRARMAHTAGSGSRSKHDQLAGVVVKDRVFVGGSGLDGDHRFLPDRSRPPRVFLSDGELKEIALSPTGPARHYLCIHVPSWGGEVFASTFLHLSADERMLYIECSRTVLGPILGAYHDIDRYPKGMPPGRRLERFAEGFAKLLTLAIGSPMRVMQRAMFTSGAAGRSREAAARAGDDLAYDYGARMSVREMLVDPFYHNYFQQLDASKHLKITETHVLGAILDFLDEHGVDTAEFRSRQTMLLNQGIIQSGGISIVGNQAVGQEAKATQQVGQPAAQRERQS